MPPRQDRTDGDDEPDATSEGEGSRASKHEARAAKWASDEIGGHRRGPNGEMATVAISPTDRTVLEQLLERLGGDVDQLAEMVLTEHDRELADLPFDEDLRLAFRGAVRADLVQGLAALRLQQDLPDTLTPETAEATRLAAASRVELVTLLRLFRVSQRVLWSHVCQAREALGSDPRLREASLELIAGFMLECGNLKATLQTEAYLAEREKLARSYEERRLAIVHEVLADLSPDVALLDYELRAGHVAISAVGPDAERVVRASAQGPRLIVRAGVDTVWAWFATTPQLDLACDPIVRIGIGRRGHGRDGFVTSHEQARAALALGRGREDPVTHFDAVALEWLATRDRAAARRFVIDELGGMLAAKQRLLDTLEAYLEAGYNASSAAARLGISVRTASYRIRTIEDLLGHSIASRNAEVHLALRLHRRLDLTQSDQSADRLGAVPSRGQSPDLLEEQRIRTADL
jgi:hypothetical protein